MKRLLIATTLIATSAVSRSALAAPITYQYSATISAFGNPAFPDFPDGTVVTGSVTFETTSPAIYDELSVTTFYNAITDFQVTIGSQTATTSQGFVNVRHDPGIRDELEFRAIELVESDGTVLLGAPFVGMLGGYNLLGARLILLDEGANTFNGTSLPGSSLGIGNFPDEHALVLEFGSSGFFAGSLTRFSAEPVPEPGSLVLLGSGLAVAWRRRRRPAPSR